MANLGKKYEELFEQLLDRSHVAYLKIDQTRRRQELSGPVKNFDYIISSLAGKYLVEVKGKTNEGGSLANWVHHSDIEGLKYWSLQLTGLRPLIVFVFGHTQQLERRLGGSVRLVTFRGARYLVVGVDFARYFAHARNMSPRWKAFDVDHDLFTTIAKPVFEFIPEIKAT